MNNFFLNITTNIMSNFLLAARLERNFQNKSLPPPTRKKTNLKNYVTKNKKSRKEETGIHL